MIRYTGNNGLSGLNSSRGPSNARGPRLENVRVEKSFETNNPLSETVGSNNSKVYHVSVRSSKDRNQLRMLNSNVVLEQQRV